MNVSTLEKWEIILIKTLSIALISFFLSYLGGHIVKRNIGAVRLGIFISVLWILFSFISIEPYKHTYYKSQNWTEFFLIGIIPVILYWGIIWVISGFLRNKNNK